MAKKEKLESIDPKEFQKLVEQVNNLKEEIKALKASQERDMNDIKSQIKGIKEEFNREMKTQVEIISDLIKKNNDAFLKFKASTLGDLESIKNQQDVLKISFTVNENKLIEKIKNIIMDEISKQIKDHELEILMKLWIDELNEISKNFDKLKTINPKEFGLKINEIISVIDLFKSKLATSNL